MIKLATRRFANRAIQSERDFGGGLAPVGEMPSPVGQIRTHAGSPAAQQIEARVIVLDQLEAPGHHAADILADHLHHLGDGGVEDAVTRAGVGT